MVSLVILIFISALLSCVANDNFKSRTGSDLTISDDFVIFALFILTCGFFDKIMGKSSFPIFKVPAIILSAMVSMIFVLMYFIPKKAKEFVIKQKQIVTQQKHDADKQAALMKEAFKHALKESSAEKDDATQEGIGKLPESDK